MKNSFQPYIVGKLTPNKLLSEWRLVFIISCVFLTITNLVYLIFGDGKTQPWDSPKRKDEEKVEEVAPEADLVGYCNIL